MPHLQHPEGVSLYLDSFLSNAVSLKSPLLSAPFSFNSISLWSIFLRQKNYFFLEKFWRFPLCSCSLSNWEKNNEMKKIVISAIVVYFLCVLVLSQGSQHFQLLSAKLPDIYLSWQKCFLVKLFMDRKFCKKMPLNSTYNKHII